MLRPKFLRARRHLKGRGGTNTDADRETQFGDEGLLQLNNKKGKKRSVVLGSVEIVRCNWTSIVFKVFKWGKSAVMSALHCYWWLSQRLLSYGTFRFLVRITQ